MSCGCPPDYLLNPDTGLCEHTEFTPLVPKRLSARPPAIVPDGSYMSGGTACFDSISPVQYPLSYLDGYTLAYRDVLGAILQPIAILVSGDLWISHNSTSRGRLNQGGIGLSPPLNDWQGYNYCVTVTNGDIYSVAVTATFAFRIKINGVLAIESSPIPPNLPSQYLQVFPLDLEEGKYNILIEARSGTLCGSEGCIDEWGGTVNCNSSYALFPSPTCPNLGVFVAEIYKNVTPQILSDTQDQANLNNLYATACCNAQGQYTTTLISRANPTDTGVNGYYDCSDYHEFCMDGELFCKTVLRVSPGTCCFTLVNCSGGPNIVTNTNLTGVENKILTLVGHTGCYVVQLNSTSPCPSPISVVVDEQFDSCAECATVYWKLTDCIGTATPIYTTTDLSSYENRSVRITGYNVCWQVTRWSRVEVVRDVVVTSDYETCEQCRT